MKLALGCEVRRIRDDSSNPTASTGVDRGQTGRCKTPVICRLARLEKRLDLGCATRNTTPQAPCTELHGRYRTPKELARNAKNPGKTFGFAAERTGTEQPTNALGNSHFDTTRDAKYDARRFHCLRRLETPSIATNLQLLCNPIYRVTISRPIQIYRVTIFRLQGHLQGHIKNP